MPVPDMKLGNSSAAMGVGAYFFILRLRVRGLAWARGSVRGSERGVERTWLPSGEERTRCNLV